VPLGFPGTSRTRNPLFKEGIDPMNYRTLTDEFRMAESRALDLNATKALQQELGRLHNEIEYLAARGKLDTDALNGCKVVMARAGLAIQQKLMPLLTEVETEALNYAGPAAIRGRLWGHH
jgi:hypothetical protein